MMTTRVPDSSRRCETGFAIVKGAPIPWQLLDRIYVDWLDFFLSDAKYEFECDPSTPKAPSAATSRWKFPKRPSAMNCAI